MSVGPSEIVVIVLVAFLLFGSRRLADLGKGIGEGIRGFRRGIAGESDSPKTDTNGVTPEPSKPNDTHGSAVPGTAANAEMTAIPDANESAAKHSTAQA